MLLMLLFVLGWDLSEEKREREVEMKGQGIAQ